MTRRNTHAGGKRVVEELNRSIQPVVERLEERVLLAGDTYLQRLQNQALTPQEMDDHNLALVEWRGHSIYAKETSEPTTSHWTLRIMQ